MTTINVLSNKHASVEVQAEYVEINGTKRVSCFSVVGSTGYHASLPACLRDECAAGELEVCCKPNGHVQTVATWLKHIKTHCHGWHETNVERFALDVLSTYGAGVRAATINTVYGNDNRASRTVGPRPRAIGRRPGDFVPAPGWFRAP